MNLNNQRITAQREGQQRLLAHAVQASPLDGVSSAVGGSMIHDDDGEPIGRVFTLAEVCDEIQRGAR